MNPPYSAQQDSENDNNKGIDYEALDKRIEATYVKESKAKLKKNLYDSYIRAIRWATDRIGDEGVVGFVTNGSFIEANNMDGLRKTLPRDFSKLYIFNLRGDQRTSGEQSRQEGGKVFGGGSRTPVAISVLVKGKRKGDTAEIFYHDIGEYLSREEKLSILPKFKSIAAVPWKSITPNADGDWVNQRNSEFEGFLPIGNKDGDSCSVFGVYSLGVITNRDPWVYDFDLKRLTTKVKKQIAFYGTELDRLKRSGKATSKNFDVGDFLRNNPTNISWTRSLKADIGRLSHVEESGDEPFRPPSADDRERFGAPFLPVSGQERHDAEAMVGVKVGEANGFEVGVESGFPKSFGNLISAVEEDGRQALSRKQVRSVSKIGVEGFARANDSDLWC